MNLTMKPNTLKRTDPPETGAEPTFAGACLSSCRKLLAQIESAKASILAEFRERLEPHEHLLELAVNEAEALAWETGFPQLLFPTLAVEKARDVATWHTRQQFVRRNGTPRSVDA
jgi:hypothetical protein